MPQTAQHSLGMGVGQQESKNPPSSARNNAPVIFGALQSQPRIWRRWHQRKFPNDTTARLQQAQRGPVLPEPELQLV